MQSIFRVGVTDRARRPPEISSLRFDISIFTKGQAFVGGSRLGGRSAFLRYRSRDPFIRRSGSL